VTERPTLLIVDDEPHIRRVLQAAFDKENFLTLVAEDAEGALRTISERPVNVVLTDVTMPGKSGYELLREIGELKKELPVVIMTAYGTIPAAVQAIRDGAFEFVTKPFDLESIKKVISAALMARDEPRVSKAQRAQRKAKSQTGWVAESDSMKAIFDTVRQVADAKATVLISGESGVGKEVVAKSLHELSCRARGPFVAVSCAALPETLLESELFGYEKGAFTGAAASKPGRFELAHGGTLFLDEIGEVPLTIQVKLLRVLQEREVERLGSGKPTRVDVRLIAATNRDLRQAVEDGTFRLDLLYRLQVVEIEIPPLRERKADIEPLARHFLAKYCRENERPPLELSNDAVKLLLRYAWPGNVRELENFMERAVVLAPKDAEFVGPAQLPSAVQRAA
jgi:DNA-binding NtrC family response regulator